ncbi:MAG: lanthionine synthetase LanC family protein, partial [Candidatus Aminicenantaceae bacterium]
VFFITCALSEERPYRDAALEATRWITASAVETEHGRAWPGVPGDEKSQNNTLYSGTPGVILFFLEAYYAIGDKALLEEALAGADLLLAALPQEKMPGLYTGISGIGFALLETYKATRDIAYKQGAEACLSFLRENVEQKGRGAQWGETTDIISGNAGTGLFLLYAGRELADPTWVELAASAGRRFIELGQPAEGGLKWAMDPRYPRLMPNFSHGTAGIAYFLATLYQATQKKEFLDAALSGATYLKAVAHTEDDACLIFHHEPEGEDLFYLGWCHGPVGTSRLFYRLFQITGDREWMDWVEAGAQAILNSGIPEKKHPGFWNNVGICCGSAGVADHFLSLYQVTQKTSYLDFARTLTTQILTEASQDSSGTRWIQAEHRSRPDFLQAQTGLMQGAAGIGLWLLRLDAHEQGQSVRIFLPDTPFKE